MGMDTYCRKFVKYRKFEEGEKKIIPTLLSPKKHFLGICYYIFIFFSSYSFKSFEDVQERAWSRESSVLLEEQAFQRFSKGGREGLVGAGIQVAGGLAPT